MKKTHIFTDLLLASMIFSLFLFACEKDDDKINITYGSMTDCEDNIYKTVKIGNQTWMAEDLKVTKLNDGTTIPLVTDSVDWTHLSTPGYTWLYNDISYKDEYGGLYNWYTVNTGLLCPIGWHVPTDAEWKKLREYLGGEDKAGGKLKAKKVWRSPNTGATNETGFTAHPNGTRFSLGHFNQIDLLDGAASWWCATESSPTHAIEFDLNYASSSLFDKRDSKVAGRPVRCVKD